MRIIPVIDLKSGIVVRGIAGQRELYRPVESVLKCDATPKGVASAFAKQFGFQTVYVADLDAIGGDEPNWDAYETIASAGFRVLIDAGIGCLERATSFVAGHSGRNCCWGAVIGLETLQSKQDLAALCAMFGRERAIFSLDLRDGRPLTKIPGWSETEPIALVDAAVAAGFERLIVLDLARVGVGEGVSVRNLCSSIRKRHPQLDITSGGGVRGRADLEELAAAGCDAALVASALHAGSLSAADVADFR